MPRELLQTYHKECTILCQSLDTPYQYTFDEVLALKMYADEATLTSLVTKTFWTNTSRETRSELYHLAITMYEACLYHSRPLPRYSSSSKSPALYYGLYEVLAVPKRARKYNGPLGHTLTYSVAHSYSYHQSYGHGMVLYCFTNYYNPFLRVIG
eukprot:270721_1